MKIDKSLVKKILLITLSNIGDAVLTLPVLWVLRREFPSAGITVVAGFDAKELFEVEPQVSRIVEYNKHISLLDKIQFGLRMRRHGFDLVVDLRHSLFPLLLGAKYNTPLLSNRKDASIHRKDKHLNRLSKLGILIDNAPFSISFSRDDKLHIYSLLTEFGLLPEDAIVAIAPGAKSHIKRWTISGFITVCDRLNREMGFKIVLIGDEKDSNINREIATAGLKEVYDLSSKTNLRELTYLLSLCRLLITNDSAPLHIASAVNTPTIAIFGPTDPKKYGPLASNSAVIRKGLACSPCEKALCRFNMECMKEISGDEVFNVVREILSRGRTK